MNQTFTRTTPADRVSALRIAQVAQHDRARAIGMLIALGLNHRQAVRCLAS